jgi:hypothetical protein
MSDRALPFERGTTQSTPGLEGEVFWDKANKQKLMVCRNTDAAALAYRRVVKFETNGVYYVDYATAKAQGPIVAGVVDPELGSSTTVPINRDFYVVIGGIVTVDIGSACTTIADDGIVVVDDDADKGKVGGPAAVATATLNDEHYAIGVNSSGAAKSGADAAVEIRLYQRW